MQLNNFEIQIQQKLSNREIKPSANSWDRLDAMLSVEEQPKKKGFFWINIAASFIVLASIGYYFYNQNEIPNPVKEEAIIVEVEEKKIDNREEKIETSSKIKNEVLVENEIKTEKFDPVVNEKSSKPSKPNKQLLVINNQGVSVINQSSENTENQNSEIKNQKSKINNRYISAERLLAEVSNTKFETKSANKEAIISKKRISVNPNTLLSETETEIYQSFRENALERLNKNYNAIKTVLANRNYEDEL